MSKYKLVRKNIERGNNTVDGIKKLFPIWYDHMFYHSIRSSMTFSRIKIQVAQYQKNIEHKYIRIQSLKQDLR